MPLMAQKSYATIKKVFSFTGSLNHSFGEEQPCCVGLSGHCTLCRGDYMLVACQTANAHCVSAEQFLYTTQFVALGEKGVCQH